MGQLFAVTADNELVTTSLEAALADRFETGIPAILQFYFLRNDWLTGPLIQDFRSIREVRKGLEKAGRSRVLEIEPVWSPIRSMRRVLSDHAVLDLNIYGRRMYVSTTGSLTHVDFTVEDNKIEAEMPVKRLDIRCLATAVKYASVVAACGDQGLFAAYDEFGTLRGRREHDEPTAVAAKSLRASWISYSLANYSGASTGTFLRGVKEEATYSVAQRLSWWA